MSATDYDDKRKPDTKPSPAEANTPHLPSEADAPLQVTEFDASQPTPSETNTLVESQEIKLLYSGPTDKSAPTGPTYRVSPASPESPAFSVPPETKIGPQEEDVADDDSGWQTAWAVIKEVGETIILTLIIFLLIQMVVRNFRVVGTSMINNLQDGQYLIIDKVSYNPFINDYLSIGGPQRGDVVVFEPPRRPEEDYVKRIIGLPGEKVQVIKGEVYVNDVLLNEPFEPLRGSYTMPEPVIVPEGQVFVLGDNRNNSNDSHNWGPLPVENIVGRAWLSYWPPELWGTIPRDEPTEQATLRNLVEDLIPSANAQSD